VSALVLADAVVVLHMAFLVYMVLGGLLALRRFHLIWPHIGVIVYSFYVTLTSFTCPVTTLERWLREMGGDKPYQDSFIHQYLRGRLYPAELETAVWISCMAIAIASWVFVLMRRRRTAPPQERLAQS
jgi:hypothetical protein